MNNSNGNEKVVELLIKLERKEIDQDTFDREIQNARVSDQNNMMVANKKNKNFVIITCIFFLVGIILIFGISKVISLSGREYEYIDSYLKIKEPIQMEYSGVENKKINGVNVRIDLNYSYDISGYVLASIKYMPTKKDNILSPIDVGIAWDDLVDKENLKHLKWMETGTRYLYWKTKDTEWYQNYGDFSNKYSNNHLIAKDSKIESLIKKIKKGDYIRLKGYLVNVFWDDGKEQFTWESSTTRYDTGMGACDVLYVTEIKWLKER